MGGHPLNQPVVGMATPLLPPTAPPTTTTTTTTPTTTTTTPTTTTTTTPPPTTTTTARPGYWMVAADGGIFAFDTPFYGSPA
jgi:hypothetical protein